MIEVLKNSTSLDRETIVDLLPFILLEIRNYTNQYFLTKHNLDVEKIENNKIYFEGDTSYFVEGDCIEILNSLNNTSLYNIKNIEDNYITVEQPIMNEKVEENVKIIKLSFKGVNIKSIINMINYEEEFGEQSGIKRQTLGGYTVEYATGGSSKPTTLYPLELYGGLNSLRKYHDDFAEYRRKGYVRL